MGWFAFPDSEKVAAGDDAVVNEVTVLKVKGRSSFFAAGPALPAGCSVIFIILVHLGVFILTQSREGAKKK